jgi:hypothetical protein
VHDWRRCRGNNAEGGEECAGHGASEAVGTDRTRRACGRWITVEQAELKRMRACAMRRGAGVSLWGALSECGHLAVCGEDER